MLTGVDLVQHQLRIAAGEKLELEQGQIWFNGHALECRLLAADGEKNFLPSPGTISRWEIPFGPGVRVDSGVACGSEVSTYYDPMIAKVICWAPDRAQAIARMEATLGGMKVEGIRTNLAFHLRVLGNAYFRRGEIDTHFLERRFGMTEGG
jgi:acetyl-CoA carboxylase biotin carboxylase subunit